MNYLVKTWKQPGKLVNVNEIGYMGDLKYALTRKWRFVRDALFNSINDRMCVERGDVVHRVTGKRIGMYEKRMGGQNGVEYPHGMRVIISL